MQSIDLALLFTIIFPTIPVADPILGGGGGATGAPQKKIGSTMCFFSSNFYQNAWK